MIVNANVVERQKNDTPHLIQRPLSFCRCLDLFSVCVLRENMLNLHFDQMFFFSVSTLQPLFAYLNQEKFPENGWSIYKPVEEFRRQVGQSAEAAQSSVTV